MKITILEPKSYCAGVSHAIEAAKKAKQDFPDKEVYILGRLVHNQIVINILDHMGIKTLYLQDKSPEEIIPSLPRGSILIFSAHGHDEKLDHLAHLQGLMVYDTTCPKVKHNRDLIKSSINNNHQVIYIGNKDHPEANAALCIDSNVILYDVKMGTHYDLIKDEAPLVINQTTLNIIELQKIYDDIKSHIPNAQLQEEICNTTRLRQNAIINMDKDIDMIIVVGDISSSNSKRLLEIAQLSHPHITSIMISDASELDLKILENKHHVAIASGASTPLNTIEQVIEAINNYY